MIGGLISLASYGYFGGGAIGNMFAQWSASGVFSYALPFLLIFALVFGILMRVKIFKDNRAINGIIALVVALMALQFDFVSIFFSEIFPRLGIGLVILLVVMILLGLFAPNRTWVTYTFFIIAAIILVVVLVNTASVTGWRTGGFLSGIYWQEWLPFIVIAVFVVIIILASIPQKREQDVSSNFMKALFGEREDKL